MTLKVTVIVDDTANQGRGIQSFYRNSINDTFSKNFLENFGHDPTELFRYDNRFN